jgi:trk system potassium uptake protein
VRIVIVGAGNVGNQLAARLSGENHDVIVIDRDYNVLRQLEEYYDLSTITGDGTSVDVLRRAGVEQADLVLAVTNFDSTNVLVCSVAKGMDKDGKAYRIARIRSSGCFEDHAIFSPADAGIDTVIYPEELAAQKVRNLIMRPFADQVFQFLNNRIEVVGVSLAPKDLLVGRSLTSLPQVPNASYRIVALTRPDQDSFIPVNRGDVLQAGDRIYIAARAEDVTDIMEAMRFDVKPAKKVFIYGGTSIGINVARSLENSDIQVSIIEPDRSITKMMAYDLRNALVLHGDGTDIKLLEGEGVEGAQVFASVTKDENANLLSCLLAKKMGVRKTIALVAKPDYLPLIGQLNVDSLISQRLMAVNRIMHLVRQGAVMQVEEMVEGFIQAMEFRVTNQTVLTDVPLASEEFKREFPKGVIIGGMVRNDEAIIPEGGAVLRPGDRVVVFCSTGSVSELERFFALGESVTPVSIRNGVQLF